MSEENLLCRAPDLGLRAPAGIFRPPLRYHGAKWRLAPWIIAQMPPHVCYVEPFGGAAGVLLRKPKSPIEVYNDRAEEVVTFFRVLRDTPGALVDLLKLTPYSRRELALAWEPLEGLSPLEQARRFYVRSWQGYACAVARREDGWRHQTRLRAGGTMSESCRDWEGLMACANRLAEVQFDCDDVIAVINRYDAPGTLFYLDPPYPAQSRKRPDHGYRFEMDTAKYEALAECLHAVDGMALISGYPCELMQRLYGRWRRIGARNRTNSGAVVTECLWLSEKCAQAQLNVPLEW